MLLRLQLDGPLAPLWEKDYTTVNDVWEVYARYLYLHRLKTIDVLCACVADAPASTAWTSEGLAVAEGRDARSGSYTGLIAGALASHCRSTTLLVRPSVAAVQLEAERESTGSGDEEAKPEAEGPLVPAPLRRFFGMATVDPDRLGRDAGRIAQEVLAHLNAPVGTHAEVTIELQATNENGFPDEVVRIVRENAAALRFRDHGFETG